MKSPSFTKENAKLQEFLNPINEEYYGSLLVYIRGKSFFKDEKSLEGALFEILQDILDAQENGETAEEYFGKQPKEIADELLKETPTNFLDSLKLVAAVLFVYSLISMLPALASPNAFFDVGKLLIGGLYWTALAILVVWQIGNDAYTTKQTFKKNLAIALTLLMAIFGIVLSVVIDTNQIINTEGIVGITMIGVLVLICGIFFLRQKEKQELFPFVPILLISAVIGILYRIPFSQAFLTSNVGKIAVVISLILGLISFYILLNRGLKAKRTDH